MTTKITIDAHAGWPVQVTRRSRNEPPGKSGETIIVEPHKQQDVYIWDDNEIIVREMKHPDTP